MISPAGVCRTSVSALCGALVLALASLATPALAAPTATQKAAARDAYKKGQQAYNLGEYAPALDAFKEAYRNVEDPVFLYNIAQCQRQLGDRGAAIRSFKTYLSQAGSASNAADVQRLLAELEAAQKADDEAKAAREREQRESDERVRIEHERAAAAAATAEHERALAAEHQASPKQPLYKKWWLWTAIGGAVVAVGLGVGLGVGLTRDNTSYPSQNTSLGTVKF